MEKRRFKNGEKAQLFGSKVVILNAKKGLYCWLYDIQQENLVIIYEVEDWLLDKINLI